MESCRTVELETSTIDALQTWRPRPDQAPLSLDLSVFVVAAAPPDIDNGNFMIVVGPNLGAASAGHPATPDPGSRTATGQ